MESVLQGGKEEGMWREEGGGEGGEGGVGEEGEEGGANEWEEMRKVGSGEGKGGMELCVWLLSSLKHLFSR